MCGVVTMVTRLDRESVVVNPLTQQRRVQLPSITFGVVQWYFTPYLELFGSILLCMVLFYRDRC